MILFHLCSRRLTLWQRGGWVGKINDGQETCCSGCIQLAFYHLHLYPCSKFCYCFPKVSGIGVNVTIHVFSWGDQEAYSLDRYINLSVGDRKESGQVHGLWHRLSLSEWVILFPSWVTLDKGLNSGLRLLIHKMRIKIVITLWLLQRLDEYIKRPEKCLS